MCGAEDRLEQVVDELLKGALRRRKNNLLKLYLCCKTVVRELLNNLNVDGSLQIYQDL